VAVIDEVRTIPIIGENPELVHDLDALSERERWPVPVSRWTD